MGKTKSDNRFLGLLTGHYAQKLHTSGNATIPHKVTEPMVLLSVVVNTSTASAITITDMGIAGTAHGVEVVAVLKASVAEQTFFYGLPCYGDLKIDNPGGSDLTIVYSNR